MSVPVGSHIKDKIKKEAAKTRRDTCKYYIRYYGACEIRKKLTCSICKAHKVKLMKKEREVADEAKRRGTSPDNNKSSVSEQLLSAALFPIITSTTPSLQSLENKHNQKSP